MELKKFIKLETRNTLEVTKAELEKLVKEYPIINICEKDVKWLNEEIKDEYEIVGYLEASDLESLLKIISGKNIKSTDIRFINKKHIDNEYKFEDLTFNIAYEYSKEGYVIGRSSWNEHKKVSDSEFKLKTFIINIPSIVIDVHDHRLLWNMDFKLDTHLDLYTPTGEIWKCSDADICADDWFAIKGKDIK